MSALVFDFVTLALSQVQTPDNAPAQVAPPGPVQTNPRISQLDGSDLVSWAAGQVNPTAAVADSVVGIWAQVLAGGLRVDVAAGKRGRGVLLFTPQLIGISLGDGRVIAPVGDHYVIDNVNSESWTAAAVCPGVVYR